MSELSKLPLSDNCLEEMRAEGVAYGKVYPAEYFEKHLKTTRDTFDFGIGVSEIREGLESDGFYLSGRGQGGASFVIVPAEANAEVMASYQRQAAKALRRGVILGTNTKLEALSDADRKKHEAVLERMAVKAALLSRSSQVAQVIRAHKPALLPRATSAS